ncbi:hypothetical protein ACX1NX_08665 [Acinetobacter sp. ANC 5383]
MEFTQNPPLIDAQSTAAYIRMVQNLDFALTPLERIVFLRLCLSYKLLEDPKNPPQSIATENLKAVATRIDIHYLKLKAALLILVQKGLLEEVDTHQLQLSKSLQVDAQRINIAWFKGHLPLKLFTALLQCLFAVRISHKQKKAQALLKLNYQQWLVLFHLVWLSDAHGMVLDADTHTLINHTGMSRAALLRAITGLFEFGIIRKKINGSLNHNLLQSVSAVYFLNLSHPIWGDSRIYADYYILRFPEGYQSVAQQAFNAIQSWLDLNQATGDLTQSDIGINVLQYNDRAKIYQLKAYHLIEQLAPQFQRGINLDPKFAQYLSLLSPDFKYSKGRLNQVEDNLQRINLLLQRYWQQRQLNVQQIVHSAVILPNDKLPRWFGSYLRPIQLSSEAQVQAKQKQMNSIHLLDALDDIRNRFLFEVAQLVFQSELFPALQWMLAAPSMQDKPQHALQPLHFAMLGQELSQQQIYYTLQPQQQQDRVFLLEFIELEGSAQGYEIQCRTLELDEDQQQSYGLLDPRFESFMIREESSTDLTDSD